MPLCAISSDEGVLTVTWSFSMPAPAVWAGFTDPAMLARWLGQPVECDLRAGGRLVVDHGEGYLSRSAVLEADEVRRLVLTWEISGEPESRVAIDLVSSEAGTVVQLEHHELGDLTVSYGPGWMTHLTFLEAAMEDAPIPAANFWKLYATLQTLHSGSKDESTPVMTSP